MLEWSADWSYRGLSAVVLENRRLRIVVLPDLGGKVWSIRDKAHDRELLWHNPRILPSPAAFGARYDDWFSGGWDELFPNDAPALHDGQPLPDHGEWWARRCDWRVEDEPGLLRLRLSGVGVVTPHRWERTIELRADERALHCATTIRNEGHAAIPFLWRIHPALPATPESRIEIPSDHVEVEPASSPGIDPRPFAWSLARTSEGGVANLGVCPDPGRERMLLAYSTRLRAGWCALTGADGVGVGFAFDPAVIDTVTVFATFGGWRGLSTVLLEPGVGWPYDLDMARANGSARVLAPGDEAEFRIAMVAYDGLTRVEEISADGVVRGR